MWIFGVTHYLFDSHSPGFPFAALAGCVSHADKIMTHHVNKFLISALQRILRAATWMVLQPWPGPGLFLSTQLSTDKSYSGKSLPALPAAGRGFQRASQCGGDEALIQSWSTMDRNEELLRLGKKENYISAIRSLIVGQ